MTPMSLSEDSIMQLKFHLADCEDENTVKAVLSPFLTAVDNHTSSDARLLTEATGLVKELSHAHAAVRSVLLEHIKLTKCAAPYIGVLAAIYASADSTEVSDLAIVLLELEDNDAIFAKVLGVILELPVEKHVIDVAVKSLRSAVQKFDVAFSASLLSLSLVHYKVVGRELAKLWRNKLTGLEVAQLTEVMQILQRASAPQRAFLYDWLEISFNSASREMTLPDTCIFLLALSDNHGNNCKTSARQLVLRLLRHGKVPFLAFKEITGYPVVHGQVWAGFHGAVWTLCLQLLHLLAGTSEVVADRADASSLLAGVVELTAALFQSAPTMQEAMTNTLLALCFPQSQGGVPEIAARKRSEGLQVFPILLPKLGEALVSRVQGDGGKETEGMARSRLHRQHVQRSQADARQGAFRKACVAVEVLEALCQRHVGVTEAVLVAFLNRSYQQLTDGHRVFPSPGIVIRLLKCCITSEAGLDRGASPHENALLNHIQKLVGSVSPGSESAFTSLFASAGAGAAPLLDAAAHTALRHRRLMDRLPGTLPVHAYSPTTVGVLLASQVLLRSGRPSAAADRHAVLTFISRALPVMQDVSILYALDALITCIRKLKIFYSSNEPAAQLSSGSASTSSSSSSSTPSSSTGASEAELSLLRNHLAGIQKKAIEVFRLTHRDQHPAFGEDPDFQRYFVSIASDESAGSRLESEPSWQVAELSAKIVSSSLGTGLAATACSAHHGSWAAHETKDLCYSMYYLLSAVAQAQSVLADRNFSGPASPSTKHRIQLSFPAGQGATTRPGKRGRRTASGDREPSQEDDAEGAAGNERQKRLDVGRSRQLWTTWSTSAADAFIGDFVLPPGLTVTQALTLAWERGLAVSVLSGLKSSATGDTFPDDSHASTVDTVLSLLCQLHSSRLMLRAAHTLYVSSRLKEGKSTSSPRTGSVVGTKRKLTRVRGDQQYIGSNGSRGGAASKARSAATSPSSKQSAEQLKMELSNELQRLQRMTLQRLLSKTMISIPYHDLLVSLAHLLRLPGRSSETPRGRADVPDALLTDAGLALLSQFVHRLHTRRASADATRGVDALDSFVPLQDLEESTPPLLPEVSVREENVVLALLGGIPALLDWIEVSRTSFSKGAALRGAPDGPIDDCSSTTGEGTCMWGALGSALDRHGCKILLLNLFSLLEAQLRAWRDCSATSRTRVALSHVWSAYDACTAENVPGNSIPVLASAPLLSASPVTMLRSGENAVVHGICTEVAGLYGCLEKRLLQQQDCTIVTAGLRCLQQLLSIVDRTAQPTPTRIGSVSWAAVRSIYTESTYLAVQLCTNLHSEEVVPGMDENWPRLVESVSSQPALQDALREIERRSNKKTESIAKLVQPCFSTRRDFHSPKHAAAEDPLSIAAYRQFWLCWWAAEKPAERVYGVAIAVREIFKINSQIVEVAAETKKSRGGKRKSRVQDSDEEEQNSDVEGDAMGPVKKSGGGAPEQMLNKDYGAARAQSSSFPLLSHSTVPFHLSITLPLLPALFLLAEPCVPAGGSASTAAFGESKENSGGGGRSTSPYESFLHTAMLFVWTVERWQGILTDEHEHLRLLISTLPMLLKVFRAALPAVEAAVLHAAQWRNRQEQPAGLGASHAYVDYGALGYFQSMVNWAYKVVQAVFDFTEDFSDTIVKQNVIKISPSLSRELPTLRKRAEHMLSRLSVVAKSHSFAIASPVLPSANKQGTDASGAPPRIGDAAMYARMVQFLTRHKAALLSPLQPDALYASVASERMSDGAAEGSGLDFTGASGHDGREVEVNDMDFDGYESEQYGSDEDPEFAALTGAQHGGWGLYDINSLEDGAAERATPTSGTNSLAGYSVSGDTVGTGASGESISGEEDQELFADSDGQGDLGSWPWLDGEGDDDYVRSRDN